MLKKYNKRAICAAYVGFLAFYSLFLQVGLQLKKACICYYEEESYSVFTDSIIRRYGIVWLLVFQKDGTAGGCNRYHSAAATDVEIWFAH